MVEQSERRVKLLYIAGWGRSGTTILDNILDQLDGFTSLGEVRWIWDRGMIENRLCGCGEHFRDCPHWGAILQEAYGGLERIDAQEIVRLRNRLVRNSSVPGMFFNGGRVTIGPDADPYIEALSKFYAAIRDVTSSRVIVDSSKHPIYASILSRIPFVDLYIVHMIRDPRAVAYSWMTRKLRNDNSGKLYMESVNPFKSSWMWDFWNMAIERLGSLCPDRYLQIKYEDFAIQPRTSVQGILELLHEETHQLPFLSETTVSLSRNHTVAGNPSRFETGTVDIKPDTRWKAGMGPAVNLFVSALTMPFLPRYGYPLLTRKSSR